MKKTSTTYARKVFPDKAILADKGKTSDIARRHGVSVFYCYRLRKKAGLILNRPVRSKELINKIVDLRLSGKSYQEIAYEVELSVSAIWDICRYAGISQKMPERAIKKKSTPVLKIAPWVAKALAEFKAA